MIIAGDALECLRLMPDECAHCCVTSPPYYGLRDYGVAGQIGLEPTPEAYVARMVEVFREVRRVLRKDGTLWLNIGDSYAGGHETGRRDTQQKRVIDGKAVTSKPGEIKQLRRSNPNRDGVGAVGSCKPKDLIGIPWMLAFALRADGWYLRRDIIWHKPNPMPESVTDRPTSAHEYLFLLTKSGSPTYWTHRDHAGTGVRPAPDYRWQQTDDNGRVIAEQDFEPPGFQRNWPHWKRINLWDGHDYFYDAEAIKEPAVTGGDLGILRGRAASADPRISAHASSIRKRQSAGVDSRTAGSWSRNKRSVWTIASAPFRGAHFATFPPALVEPCILAGTSARGVCPKCGAPWERVLKRDEGPKATERGRRLAVAQVARTGGAKTGGTNSSTFGIPATEMPTQRTIGWRPTCSCNAGAAPATMLDPFAGASTTALVADRLNRRSISIELSAAYFDIACERISAAQQIAEAA